MEGSADKGCKLDELKDFFSKRYDMNVKTKQKNLELGYQSLEFCDCLCRLPTLNVRGDVLQ